ncbi:hypothetical protein HYALB_00011947 [Hymenoscyphus albidus]|uniref:Uncharacterized protein n=1 Tax=Hymenoscyphus albidus TaxID=595503 RepID=A0A9N9LVY9_9HELO|nr:hypothetical protein HYALB_00011947 [Hymenoscyphus albidus]
MASTLTGSLMKRGMEVATYARNGGEADGGEKQYELPLWGLFMLGATMMVAFIGMSMVEYTFGRIIPTLVMIESPPETISFEPVPTEDSDAPKKTPELEAETVKPKPITSSFRTTLQVLDSKGGFRARFRGVWVFFVSQIAFNFIVHTLLSLSSLLRFVAPIIASVALAQLSLAWTLIVISEPSPKTWFRRLPAKSTWKKVAIPTAVLAITQQLALQLPFYLAVGLGLTEHDPRQLANVGSRKTGMMLLSCLAVFASGLLVAFFLVIPANVTLVRVQASLLSDAEETIVPFDRSFNGKVIPEFVGGTGVIGMLDAWKTFDWSARVRLLKAYVKVLFLQIALYAVLVLAIFAQLFIIMGRDIQKLAPSEGGHPALI